ncbi:lysoplasmalogenase [Streptomyces xanthii]|uniref:Lysoplasmalogenase n=1 Tax=Streptomyces xanthii TaxID=2768069 RepID=A0A7H1BE45_9ACTN|nr:lysoplasmalogenase [Streptomyces xanthii]QNS07000.1 lysoplasmalogenase [Streptomyces xanthii]
MNLPAALRTAFFALCATDLVALLADVHAVHVAVKPLLMLVLIAYVIACGGPRLLSVALLFGWGGDVLLLFDHDLAFLAGMGSFAAGHICYLLLFKRNGKPRPPGTMLGVVYCVVLVNTVAALWPDLPADLRIPVAAYSVLLTAMAFGSSRLGKVAGIGGALFLLSDTLIAMGVAEWPALPRPDFWVMLTYVAAQYLLAQGALEERTAQRAAYGEERAETRPTPH